MQAKQTITLEAGYYLQIDDPFIFKNTIDSRVYMVKLIRSYLENIGKKRQNKNLSHNAQIVKLNKHLKHPFIVKKFVFIRVT